MYGLVDNEFMLFKDQRSVESQAQRQECDRKNSKAKMVVKSMENRQGDQICSFCCYLLWSGTREDAVKFCAYVK